MQKPRVAIIYLCNRDMDFVSDVVESWEALTYPCDRMMIIMVPNGAKDGMQNYILENVLPKSKKELPEVIMIDDGANRGFAGGNNLGIKMALDSGFDFIFLNNGDLKLSPGAIEELVKTMESDDSIGSAQSFVKLWQDPNTVNTTGGVIHVAGFGYACDNGIEARKVHRRDCEEIMYASGAAVMYRASALKHVGLLEEGFFMYHEDLELGLRLQFAGYKNVLSLQSTAYHNYNFSRNPKKFQWMETYRIVVLLSYLHFRSLIVLLPILKIIEIAMWPMSLKGGWFGAKFMSTVELCKPKTWKLIASMRARAQKLRVINDYEWMQKLSPVIEYQGTESVVVKFGNRVITRIWKILLPLIRW